MALEDKFAKKEAPKGKQLSDDEETDANLATAMAASVMSSPEMIKALVEQTANAEPVMAVGQYIAEAMLNLKEQADKNGLDISDSVWTADGGVADRLIDQAVLNIVAGGGPDLEGQEEAINEEVLNVLKMAMQTGGGGGQPPQGPQQPGPPVPAGPPAGPPQPGVM